MLTLRNGTHKLFCNRRTSVIRLLSAQTKNKRNQKPERRDYAWTVFAALEKAKEARAVQVAQLVSSLEVLLPRVGAYEDEFGTTSEQHTFYQEHTSDPAFFSLPDVVAAFSNYSSNMSANKTSVVTGTDVRNLLKATRQGRRVSLHVIEALITAASQHFQSKPSIVSLPSLEANQQLTVIGDLHGSLTDLETVLGLTGEPNQNNLLLFNGDLADRGDHGVEVIVIVCSLCLAYPDFVHVNRGNHEDLALSIAYGLAAEVQHKYGSSVFRNILGPTLDGFFRSLPLATVLDKDALIVHAGPPPPNVKLSDVLDITNGGYGDTSRTICMKTDVPIENEQEERAQEIIETLLWSDPIIDQDEDILADYRGQTSASGDPLGWISNTSRGAGHKYSAEIVRNVLQTEGLFRLIRSHEPVHHTR